MMTLVSVLTLGVGIKDWQELGLLGREIELYKRYVLKEWRVVIVSSSSKDKSSKDEIRKMFPEFHFIFVGRNPFIQYFKLRFSPQLSVKNNEKRVIRSNQLLGSHLIMMIRQKNGDATIKVLRMGFNPITNYTKMRRFAPALILKIYLKSISKRCDTLETTNKNSLEEVSQFVECKVEEIPNFVDSKVWTYNKTVSQKREKSDFVYFGRLENEKNLFNLIQAIAKIDSQGLFIGSGKLETTLKNYAEKSNAKINFVPHLKGIELVNRVKSARFAVLVSNFEGNPKTILESISIGIPVIVTPIPSIRSIIRDGENGIITNGFGIEDISEGLLRALSLSNKRYEKMSRLAIETSLDFRIETIIDKQIDLYKSILNEKSNATS
jgi:glycosyltransferase involved in cell wall biosynthesis